LFRLL